MHYDRLIIAKVVADLLEKRVFDGCDVHIPPQLAIIASHLHRNI
jgi:hypothetical protein